MVTVIFDLETSGLNPYHDDIIEIGAKVLNTDNSFQCLVKPKSNRPISKKITEITPNFYQESISTTSKINLFNHLANDHVHYLCSYFHNNLK